MSAWYRAGTVTVANGSVYIVGVNTYFTVNSSPGDVFTLDGVNLYEVLSVDDDTHITLASAYLQASGGAQSYSIIRNFTGTTNATLAIKLTTLLNSWQAREDEFATWQGGTTSGGPSGNGTYPLTNAIGQSISVQCPAKVASLTDVAGLGATIYGATAKTTPADADCFGLMDSAAGNLLKKLSWSSLKLTLRAYFSGYATTATAAGVTTLDVASAFNQYFTGTTTQTVVMPVTSTLVAGQQYRFVNNSTGTIAINSSGNNTIASLPAGYSAVLTCILLTGTTAASWGATITIPVQGPGSTQAFATGLLTMTGFDVTTLDCHMKEQLALLWSSNGTSSGTLRGYIYCDSSNIVHILPGSGGYVETGALTVKRTADCDTGNSVAVCGTPVMGSALAVYAVSVYGANAANAAVKLGTDAVTGRSLTAGGTVLGGGADYAEYEKKSVSCATVEKGQIIGFDVEGKITDLWINAVSFGIKTTNPSFVGGDAWGSEDVIGKRPEQIAEDAPDEEKAIYAARLTEFECKLEAERQKVDRIAYSGKVPCNVLGAEVGDYVMATQDGDFIKGVAVASPTFEQYMRVVGRVRRVLCDGRAYVAVVVH